MAARDMAALAMVAKAVVAGEAQHPAPQLVVMHPRPPGSSRALQNKVWRLASACPASSRHSAARGLWLELER